MRQPHRSLALAIAAAFAVASLSVVTAAQAQMRGGGLSAGPRISVSPRVNVETASPKVSIDAVGVERPRFSDGPVRSGALSNELRIRNRPARVVVDHPKGGGRHPVRPVRIVRPGIGIGIGAASSAAAAASAAAATSAAVSSATLNARQRAADLSNGIDVPPPNENRFVADELLLEFTGGSPAAIAQVLARRGLVSMESQYFVLTGSTVVRARIANRSDSVRSVLQGGLRTERLLRSGQPNYLYSATGDTGAQSGELAKNTPATITPAVATAAALPANGDPAQYALGKLHLGEAHMLSNGNAIVVAVIDSAIDTGHPDLAGTVSASYDALGKPEAPHQHGTAIAGAIAAHARLMGAAPAAKILAIHAFSAEASSARATTMAILKGLDYAVRQRARIINMSFAGPSDAKLSRALASAKGKGVVLVAASGNLGPDAPPQYPAADPNVIAVSATDADDKLFSAASIGPHIAVAAPGVDILLPSPGNEYRVISGTSFAAAYVSGVAALMLQRAPGLSPDRVRDILQKTAKDLGAPGKDPEFGTGLVDAYQALMAAQPAQAAAERPTVK
jgi:subtilisin family serine protease